MAGSWQGGLQPWHGGGMLGGAATAAAGAWSAAAAGAWSAAATPARLLQEDGGNGLSNGMTVLYIVVAIVLVAISGLMAGLVLGLLSLDRMDLEVLRRTGNERQKWLVGSVEPFTRDPHFTMCSLVVVNAACNTALPLFIDRLLNPLAALLISVTAILLFAEIAPQAVCKRYGLEIGAYCSWLVRGLMVLTAPVSWPLAKALDWLLGEESALFRRQELNALISLHAEPQHDGSVGALTSDEATVIQGALELASKTAEAVMTPLAKVFMLSSEAVIDAQLLATVLAAGHSRVPVHEGDNKQAIIGLVLVKELVLVDEQAGVKVRDLRLREMPFLRADIPLYDVLKIFRFGRKHMACLTRVSHDPSSPSNRGTLGGGGGGGHHARSASASGLLAATVAGQQVEEVVGIVTIEDVLEELLQAEIVDETDRYEDNLQTVQATPQVSMKELPPHLRRFLSPHRSLHGFRQAAGGGGGAIEIARLSPASATSSKASGGVPALGSENQSQLPPGQGNGVSTLSRQRSMSHSSLGAAAAASALMALGSPSGGGAEAMAAAMAAGVRAAELNAASSAASIQAQAPKSSTGSRLAALPLNAGTDPAAVQPATGSGRPPLPPRSSGRSASYLGPQHVVLEMGDLHVCMTTSSEASETRAEEDQHWPLVRRGGRQSGSPG